MKEGERGTVYYPNGERYRGTWHANKKEGKGTISYKNGNRYALPTPLPAPRACRSAQTRAAPPPSLSLPLTHSLTHSLAHSLTRRYEGGFKSGQRHGQGTLWINDGGKYRVLYMGRWHEGRKQGYGVCVSKDGDRYEGEWMSGLRHGVGRQTYGGRASDGFGGDEYEGEWKEGKRCGRGTLTLASGAVYTGEWLDDEKHGEGVYEYANGSKMVGVWVNGVAKTGEYSWLEEETEEFPPLELSDAEGVLAAAKEGAMHGGGGADGAADA